MVLKELNETEQKILDKIKYTLDKWDLSPDKLKDVAIAYKCLCEGHEAIGRWKTY